MNAKQLFEKVAKGYIPIYPLASMDNIVDENQSINMTEVLNKYNHIYLTFANSSKETRLLIPEFLRRYGLWISYEKDGSLYTEFFKGSNVDAQQEERWSGDEYWEYVPDLQYINDASQRIPNGAILPEHLSDSLKQLISERHIIRNMVDDEDLTTKSCGIIKFKDREYSPTLASGKGYKILRKNWVGGKNILTQEDINKENTVYEIRYDFDLNGKEIIIPEGCILEFKGGSFKKGSIIFNDTELFGIVKIDCAMSGFIQNKNVYIKWFNLYQDGVTDDSKKLHDIFSIITSNTNIYFPSRKEYLHGDGIKAEDGTGNSYTQNPIYPTRPLIDDTHPVDIGRDIRLMIINKNNINIYGNNCKIVSNPNNGECRNNAILWIENAFNINIYDLTLDGNKDNRKPIFSDYNTGKGEADRHNIVIFSSYNILFRNIHSDNSIHNGFSILKSYKSTDNISPHDITFENCSSGNSYKNNIGINSGYNYIIQGGEYYDAGKNYGISPRAGIDIETEISSDINTKVIVKNVHIHNCNNNGLVMSGSSTLTDVSNCQFNQSPIVVGGNAKYNSIHNNIFKNSVLNCSHSNVYGNIVEFDSALDPNAKFLINISDSYLYNNDINGNNFNYGDKRLMINAESFAYNNYIYNIITTNANVFQNSYVYNNVFENITVNNNSIGENIYKNCVHTNINNISISGNAGFNTYSTIIRPNSYRYIKFTNLNTYDSIGVYFSSYKIVYSYFIVEKPSDNIEVYKNSATKDIIVYIGEPYSIPSSILLFVNKCALGASSFNNKFYDSSNIEILESPDLNGFNKVESLKTSISNFNTLANIGNIAINRNNSIPYFWDGKDWVNSEGISVNIPTNGISSLRPINVNRGFQYFDTTLRKPIWWNGTKWTDATGADV